MFYDAVCFCPISSLCLSPVPFYLFIHCLIFRETKKKIQTWAEIEKISLWKHPFVLVICSHWTGSDHERAFFIAPMCSVGLQSIYVHILIWLVFLPEEYTLLITFTLDVFKVNQSVSRTYWTWLAGSITMRCPHNGRVPIPDLPIYLAVLMSAY